MCAYVVCMYARLQEPTHDNIHKNLHSRTNLAHEDVTGTCGKHLTYFSGSAATPIKDEARWHTIYGGSEIANTFSGMRKSVLQENASLRSRRQALEHLDPAEINQVSS